MPKDNSVSDRIYERMQRLGISYGELADKTGIYKSALQRYATGFTEKIPLSAIERIAVVLGCSAAYLVGWDTDTTDKGVEWSGPAKAGNLTHNIPILGRVAAGLPLLAEQNIEGYTWTDLNGGAEYFALRVQGDSMNAANIPNGSLVIVRRQEQVENGEIAVVLVGDQDGTVKRYRRDGDNVMLIPQSFNPVHQVQVYNIRDVDVKVLGLVRQIHISPEYE